MGHNYSLVFFYGVVLLSYHGLYNRTPILLLEENIFRVLLVAGCLWLFQSSFISLSLLRHGYQHRIYAVLVFLLFLLH